MNHISLTIVEMPFGMVVEKRVPPLLQPVPAPSPQAARPFLPHLDGTASVLRLNRDVHYKVWVQMTFLAENE